MISKLLDFIFPPICPVCGASVSENGTLCAACWGTFDWISDPKCACCGYPFPANIDLGPHPLCPTCAAGNNIVDWCRSACVYDDASKSVMLPFKHADALKYRDMMARAMINSLRDIVGARRDAPRAAHEPPLQPIDLVLPVPLANRRLFYRGYNQAALLARPIAKHLGVPMDTNSVRRKYRRDMGHMTFKQRRENIRGVFLIKHPETVRGKTILLVDDVMTSGATFAELGRVLKRAGADAVYGVTFCRVVKAI